MDMLYEAKGSSDMPKYKVQTGVRRPGHKAKMVDSEEEANAYHHRLPSVLWLGSGGVDSVLAAVSTPMWPEP